MKNGAKSLAKGPKKNSKAPSPVSNPNLLESAEAFREAARIYTKKAVRSKASAIETLHREGILTKRGKLTKAYA